MLSKLRFVKKLVALPFRSKASSRSKNINIQNLTHMWHFVKEEKYRLFGAVGLLFISSGVTLSVPLIMGKFMDIISSDKGYSLTLQQFYQKIPYYQATSDVDHEKTDRFDIKKYSYFICGFFVIGGLANFGRFYLIQTTGQNIIRKIRNRLFESLTLKPVEFFDLNKSGDLISRITADATVVGEGLSSNISNGLRSTLQTFMGLSMMMYVSPQLTMYSMLIIPPIAAATILFGRQIRKVSKNVQNCLSLSTDKAGEVIGGIKTVKLFGKEKEEIQQYYYTTGKVLEQTYKEALLRGGFFGLTGMSGNFLILYLLFVSGSLINSQQLTIGGLSSFLVYSAYATVSVGGIGTFYTELMKTSGAGTRLWELLGDKYITESKQPSEPEAHQRATVSNLIQFADVKFDNVSFVYPTRPETLVLNKFSLIIPKGKTTCLIGSSGCGKSSVASLLLRFYDVRCGKIMVGNTDLTADIDPVLWRQRVSAVLQEPVLFSCSIAENIAYGARNLPSSLVRMDEIEKVAEKARILEFTDMLPNGLDTKIGERGVLLSGGQRQRIAIARAFMADPDFVILDEATSALDRRNEDLVQMAISEVFAGRTILIISHRMNLLRSADSISLMENGQVVRSGSLNDFLIKGSKGTLDDGELRIQFSS